MNGYGIEEDTVPASRSLQVVVRHAFVHVCVVEGTVTSEMGWIQC